MALNISECKYLTPLHFKGLNNLEVKYRSDSTKLDPSEFELLHMLMYNCRERGKRFKNCSIRCNYTTGYKQGRSVSLSRYISYTFRGSVLVGRTLDSCC